MSLNNADNNTSRRKNAKGGKRVQGKSSTSHGKKPIFRKWMYIPIIVLTVVLGVFIAVRSLATRPQVEVPSIGEGAEGVAGKEPTGAMTSGRKTDFFTFLLCGTDDGNGGTDTIIVAAYDVQNQKMNLMSIPRDTMVNVEWSTKKINSTYNAGGIERLKEEVGDLIGFPVDFYIKVDLEGFVELIDAIGGVEFNVPYDMDYDDPTQNLSIHVEKGLQRLNGEDAVGVVRWRKNNDGTGYSSGDIGRIQTQQAFLAALGEQCLNIGNITKVQEFAQIFARYVDTNLTLGNIVWLGQKALGMDVEDVHFFTLPGNYNASYRGASYVLPDHQELLDAVNAYLNPYIDDVAAQDMDIMSITSSGRLTSSTGELADGTTSASTSRGSTSSNTSSEVSIQSQSTSTPSATLRVTATPRPSATPQATATPEPSESVEPSSTPHQSEAPEPVPSESVAPTTTVSPTALATPTTPATTPPVTTPSTNDEANQADENLAQ